MSQLSYDLEVQSNKLKESNTYKIEETEEKEIPIEEVKEEIIVEETKVIEDVYEITAYTAGYESTGKYPSHKDYGITASGEYVQEGRTLACPKEFAFGTVIEIEGIGERVCTDRGGAIKGKILDLYIPKLSDALDFGRQRLKVWIKEG